MCPIPPERFLGGAAHSTSLGPQACPQWLTGGVCGPWQLPGGTFSLKEFTGAPHGSPEARPRHAQLSHSLLGVHTTPIDLPWSLVQSVSGSVETRTVPGGVLEIGAVHVGLLDPRIAARGDRRPNKNGQPDGHVPTWLLGRSAA